MKVILIVTAVMFGFCGWAQSGEWVWINGDSTLNSPGSYGTRGVSSPGSQPHSRYAAVSWKDNNGDLWLLGGNSWSNDMWKYNIATNQWAWMNGDTVYYSNGQYGVQGVPATGNRPTGRFASTGWTDKNGNLWLFGGYAFPAQGGNYGYMNDLWKYDVATNRWTWIGGDTVINTYGIYGTQGVASPSNKPGGRRDALKWTDKAGNLWLFGGYGYAAGTGPHTMNDLWKYDISNNQWTWVKGDSTGNQPGVYGTQGIANPANQPGARQVAATWVDTSGDFWLFGGLFGYRNDLWRYQVASNQWTWVKGSNITNDVSVYGVKGTPAPGNKPGGRQNLLGWTDENNNLWLFGGEGKNTSGTFVWFNELWKYNIATNEWAWIKGENTGNNNGIYGTKGIADAANTPGSRISSIGWTDKSGSLWLFGGYGYAASGSLSISSSINDLWKYDIGAAVMLPAAQFSILPDTVCAGGSVSFTDLSANNPTSWQWTFTGGTPVSSASQNPVVTYNTPGSYPVKLVVRNNDGADSITKAGVIIVNALPQPLLTITDTVICTSDSSQVCVAGNFAAYQWNTSSTSQCIWAKVAGGVWATVTDANGCTATANRVNISVYPVPVVSVIVSGDTLSSFGAYSYQWFLNDSSILGAVSPVYIALQSGNYAVEITDTNGCKALSGNTPVFITGITELNDNVLKVYPNPSTGLWYIIVDNELVGALLQVYNIEGRLVYQSEIRHLQSKINISTLPGMYMLRISSGQFNVVRKLVKW